MPIYRKKKKKQKKEKSSSEASLSEKWYKEKIFLVVGFLIVIQVAHYILDYLGIGILHDLIFSFYDYLEMIWLPIVVGLLLGGIIDHFVPQRYILKYLSLPKRKTIFYSVGLGFLMSACSHGILAISIELYRKGASIPAVIAFLLASPWANLPITIILIGFFGLKGLIFICSAIIIALNTGFIYQILEKKGLIKGRDREIELKREEFSIFEDIKTRWREYEFSMGGLKNDFKSILESSWKLTKMILWWILIGMFLASLARTYIPQEFFVDYMGPTLIGLLMTLFLATIIEICSEGSSPLAFEIFRQTGALGNPFVFLMAGVATDYTEIGLIWYNIGKRAAIFLPIITVPQIMILGYLFNLLL